MISQAFITAILGPGRATGAGQGAFDRAARTHHAWSQMRGSWAPADQPESAPCPRCGLDLRSSEHDFEEMRPFCDWDGVELTLGWRCVVREKAASVVIEESKGARDWKQEWARRKGKVAA